jgi:hypothetical protein
MMALSTRVHSARRPETEAGMRLGEFLVMRGRVSKTEVDIACRTQLVANHLIGILAVDQGLMTADELEQVLIHQATARPELRFGEVALGLGMITRSQLDGLLELQVENRLRIGEALVLQSCLTERELRQELKAYREFLISGDRAA